MLGANMAPKPDKERTESIFLNDTPGAPRGAALGSLWAHLGWLLGALGRLLDGYWPLLDGSWGALERSWIPLWRSWAVLGPMLAPQRVLGSVRGGLWALVDANMAATWPLRWIPKHL